MNSLKSDLKNFCKNFCVMCITLCLMTLYFAMLVLGTMKFGLLFVFLFAGVVLITHIIYEEKIGKDFSLCVTPVVCPLEFIIICDDLLKKIIKKIKKQPQIKKQPHDDDNSHPANHANQSSDIESPNQNNESTISNNTPPHNSEANQSTTLELPNSTNASGDINHNSSATPACTSFFITPETPTDPLSLPSCSSLNLN
jgi:hypothetical protein